MKHIESKAEFYRLSKNFELGNRLTQWTWEEFKELYISIPDTVGVRHVGNSFTNKAKSTLMSKKKAFVLGYRQDGKQMLFDEGVDPLLTTVQGEAMPTEHGLYFRYSYAKLHQRRLWERDAKHPELNLVHHAFRLQAKALLQKYMDGNSWDMLNEILSSYYYPVVEFSCFDRPVGILGWNTLFWEVRTKY